MVAFPPQDYECSCVDYLKLFLMNKGILMVIDTGSSHGVASLIFCPLFCIFENMQLKMYKYFSFPSCYVLRTCCQLVYEYNSELKKKNIE